MAPERTFYLDAGPVVAIICEDDMFHRATKTVMSILPGRKVTSYISILESLVVLRRADKMDMGESFDQDATYRMWETIIGQMAKAEIEVRSTHILAPLDKESAMGMLRALSVEPDTRRRKNSKPWVRSVGVIDCFHLKAAESLGATHFLTTDRCLSKVETDMVMMLIGIYGNSADILRPSLLVRRQKKSRGEQILREEAVLTCRQPAAVEE